MSNPLISVQSAIYGSPESPGAVVDVTAAVQRLFEEQYFADRRRREFHLKDIRPALFGIPDPALGRLKTFTIAYTLPGPGRRHLLSRGAQDRQSSSLELHPGGWLVEEAHYGAGSFGLDLTEAVSTFLADPRSGANPPFAIGSDLFLARFCGGSDPAPGVRKFFSITFRHSPASRPIHLCGFDGETVQLTPADIAPNATWMEDLAGEIPGFRDFPLRRICLPASHDSGTFSFLSQFTKDPQPWIQPTMDAIKHINDAINIPGIGHFLNPASWAYDGIMGVTRNFATATRSPALQQLRDGIRCFDLRIYYNRRDATNPFYTYHSLAGVPLAQILSEVEFFLSSLAPEGEIVYLTLGHYLDDDAPRDGFTPLQVAQLTALLRARFPDRSRVFGPDEAKAAGKEDDLFECTYGEIVGDGAEGRKAGSKVILVLQDPPAADSGMVWPAAKFSPPKPGPDSRFGGSYTHTDLFPTMLADQQEKSRQTRSDGKPFALYLTLTPSDGTVTVHTVTSLQNAVLELIAWAALVPVGWVLLPVFTGLEVFLAALIAGKVARYDSLRQLSTHLFSAANPTVEALVRNEFTGPAFARPSFIYLDFYEDHLTSDSGGNAVAQLVETAKKITSQTAVTEAAIAAGAR